MEKIYVKFKFEEDNVQDFLDKLFSHKIISGLNIGYQSVDTYTDEECIILQCYEGKNRSVDEVILIVNTYFPDLTIKEIVHNLIILDKGTANFYPMYCGNISRPVMLYHTSLPFTIDDISGGSKFNWYKLLNEIGIKSSLELRNYKENYYKNLKEKEEICVV